MPFELAHSLSKHHLVPQRRDLALQPPESYLLVQDFLIISCGVLYTLCYAFYMSRIVADKYSICAPWCLCPHVAWEIYYAFATTTTRFERASFSMWFLMDVSFATIWITSIYAPGQRRAMATKYILGALAGLAFLHMLCKYFPDEREQVTAYWTGLVLELPLGWFSLFMLLRRGDTKGQSLEIWITRYLGCLTAYGVFIWRYLNVPQNWPYVGSQWSIWIIVLTLIPETLYPFVHVWVYSKEHGKAKVA